MATFILVKGCLDEKGSSSQMEHLFPLEDRKRQAWGASTLPWDVPQFLVFAWDRPGHLARLGTRASLLW